MKKLNRTIIATLLLMTLLVPTMAYAQENATAPDGTQTLPASDTTEEKPAIPAVPDTSGTQTVPQAPEEPAEVIPDTTILPPENQPAKDAAPAKDATPAATDTKTGVNSIGISEANSGLTKDQIRKITERMQGCDSLALNNVFKEANFCLNEKQKTDNIYTVLETPLETPDSTAPNSDGTMVKSCARFTQILNCKAGGKDPEKISDQYLVDHCPPSSDLPGKVYGSSPSGTDSKLYDYYDCQPVTVIMSPLEQGATGFLNVYVALIYRWVAGIIGVICVMIMIISGLQIITAQGEPSAVEEAKKRIFQSIGGIALLFLASAILYIVNPTFFNPPKYPTQQQNNDAKTYQQDIKQNTTVPNDQGAQDQIDKQNGNNNA